MTDTTAAAPVFFITHAGSIQTALGKAAYGPVATLEQATAVATSLARGKPAQIYQATLVSSVAPSTAKSAVALGTPSPLSGAPIKKSAP